MKQTKTTNPELVKLIRSLRKSEDGVRSPIWYYVASCLVRSRRNSINVNISRLNRYTKEGETVVIPGKVLGAGSLDHPITVAAFTFSGQARLKVEGAKGKCLSISDLVKKNPEGKKVKVIG